LCKLFGNFFLKNFNFLQKVGKNWEKWRLFAGKGVILQQFLKRTRDDEDITYHAADSSAALVRWGVGAVEEP
jgi:hypothetical protein